MPSEFEQLKIQFLADIRTIVIMEDIPAELVINWDQAGLKYVPVPDWAFEERALKESRLLVLMIKGKLLSCYCVP